MQKLKEMVIEGKINDTADYIRNLLENGIKPETIMKEALIPAMDEVGDLFQKGDFFLPEMLVSGEAMKRGLDVLRPILAGSGIELQGKIVLGTVQGDLHDIGKNIVAMSLEGAGFEVIDIGNDVSPEKFVAAIKEHSPRAIGLSTLLSTTMAAMKNTIDAITEAGLRDKVKIMVGGAPVQQNYADDIGADFYGPDSTSAMKYARQELTV